MCAGRFCREKSGSELCYNGGKKNCVWVKENMVVVEVLRLVEEAIDEGLRGQLIWYSLNYNQMKLLPFGSNGDVRKLMKSNDEYARLYVAGSEGLCETVTWQWNL